MMRAGYGVPTTRRHPRTMYGTNAAFPRDPRYANAIEVWLDNSLSGCLLRAIRKALAWVRW